MKKFNTLLRSLFAIAIMAGSLSFAQDNIVANKNVDLAQKQLENVRIEEENIEALFSHFAFAYKIPIGLEVARNEDDLTGYRIDFKKGTLADLLTQFVAEHKQYDWKIENEVLSIFPKEEYRDPIVRKLLTTNISNFSVKAKTSTWGFGEALVATPEIKSILKRHRLTTEVGYLGGFYIQQLGQQFTLDVSNMKLKSILDNVIKKSPVAKNWIIANRTTAHTIFLRVKADIEYPPQEAKTPD